MKALFVGRVCYLGLVFPEAGRLQDIQTCMVFYRICESTLNQTPTWNHTKSGKHLICTRVDVQLSRARREEINRHNALVN